jgi:glucan phosphoethanolaminetransferase (alkaline phosphatase superfamily)
MLANYHNLHARFSLLVAALIPLAIWPISQQARLARPVEVAIWGIVCACLVATVPARWIRPIAWLQIIAMPWTLGWLGTVAVTGYGPSYQAFEAAVAFSPRILWAAFRLAMAQPAFIVVALLTLVSRGWVLWVSRSIRRDTEPVVSVAFLCTLSALLAINLDGANFPLIARIAGPEAKLAVPFLSHLSNAKEKLMDVLDNAAYGSTGTHSLGSIRTPVSQAPKLFDAHNDLAIFVVGESLRADFFIDEARGPWSKALVNRLSAGLGVRFPDACSGSNATHASVPRLFTGVDVGDIEGAARNPTVLALAKAAGARTAYFTNHEIWVVPESGHDWQQNLSAMNHHGYDDIMVEALDDFDKRFADVPKAAILHIFGQHFLYQDRYPGTAFGPEPNGLSAAQLETLRYARAAEYGNKVLLELGELLDAQPGPAFLVFTSDHGEDLTTDGTGRTLHAGPVTGRHVTTVPALALWNRAFLESGQTKVLEPMLNAKGLLAHSDVVKAWLVLAGMPGTLAPTADPKTWGSIAIGDRAGIVSCADLMP